MKNRKYYLLNYIFVLGIILLFLNDHFFKWQFSNWITGKLSDFIGLLILPFLLSFVFPKHIKWNVIFTGVFFVFWKSSFSQSFIDFYNSITFIKITRVVDYSDLITLSILPLSYYFLKRIHVSKRLILNRVKIHPLIILFPSIVVFMATSPPYWHNFTHSDGNVKFFKNTISLRKSQDEILKELGQYNINAVIDTSYKNNPYSNGAIKELGFYYINELVIDADTIHDLKFSMVSFKKDKKNKTKIFINAMNISEDIEDTDIKKELRKYYKKLLRKYIKRSLK